MSWRAHLALDYRRDGERTLALDRHEGPLRVLQSLYPEGPGVCHHVIVHPPGGIVGGDVLEVQANLGEGTHAVVTTPGAARFYRSDGALALQQATLTVADGARLEWLPLETIAYSGCVAENRLDLALAPGAEAMGWDVLALGLPTADQPFVQGRFLQHLQWPGHWLERGSIDAADATLLDGPLGLAGRRVLGTLWFASGRALTTARRELMLDAARAQFEPGEPGAGTAPAVVAGATAPQPGLVVLRALAHRVEPLMALFQAVRAAWRMAAWQRAAHPPRVWRL